MNFTAQEQHENKQDAFIFCLCTAGAYIVIGIISVSLLLLQRFFFRFPNSLTKSCFHLSVCAGALCMFQLVGILTKANSSKKHIFRVTSTFGTRYNCGISFSRVY